MVQLAYVKLTRPYVRDAMAAIADAWTGAHAIDLDLSRVEEIDSAGAALLALLKRRAAAESRVMNITGVRPHVARTLELFPYAAEPPTRARAKGWTELLGERAAQGMGSFAAYAVLCADLLWFTLSGLFRRRGVRWAQVLNEMASMGSRAVGVVGLIAFLVGATIALQSAVQLRQFGAHIFVADLLGVSLTRELGPLMAAIVVAGRSGSAIAAEIATMVITEEIDALRAMGLNPVRFLVVPKVVAITITQPILTTLGNALGLLGGLVVSALYLDIAPQSFLIRLQEALFARDLYIGLFKSVLFAQLIVSIGAAYGLKTRGGADEVGRSTTASVVASIFAVIVADAVCSLVFYFGE